MKAINFLKVLVLAMFISLAVPSVTHAAADVTANSIVKDTTGSAEVYSKLVTRLSEIQSMDKSSLTKQEKRSLKSELKDMKKAADGLDSKVYISIGGIIIAILLLILILR